MSGLQYIDGVPHVWGKPAIKDDSPPLLDCFSQWLCPHCGASMSKEEEPICLNGCHFTAPQIQRFQDLIRRASHQVPEREQHQSQG